MLEYAEYFVRSFIRGPVCRGQLATDVIRDHFWVMFQAPDADPYIVDPEFRREATPLLGLPSVNAVVRRWGVSRSNVNFWDLFHDVNRHMIEIDATQAGVLDINRYVNFKDDSGGFLALP